MSSDIPSAPALRGKRLGAFEVGELLGEGGMGAVFNGRDVALDRPVAIKVLHTQLAADHDFVDRFVREARTAARLNHTNVVQIYGAGYEGGVAYMALELVDGCSLFDLSKAQHPFPPRRACELIRDVARGLGKAHELGIVHRDIKPENILVSLEGTPKLADFGLARAGNQRITETGVFLGTPQYASPEQCNAAELTPTSDLYSLGVVLYELLAGRPPYEAPTPLTLFKKILMDPPRPLAESCPDLPPSLIAVVDRLLEKEPERRYEDAKRLADDLERVLPSLPEVAPDADPYALIPVARADSRTVQVASGPASAPFGDSSVAGVTSDLPAAADPAASLRVAQRVLFGLVGVLICVLVALVAARLGRRPAPAGGTTPDAPGVQQPLRVAVIPWVNQAQAPDFAWLERALPDFLVTQLGQWPEAIQVEPPANVGEALRDLDLSDPAQRRQLAQALGVDLIVGGSFYVAEDGQVGLNARVETAAGAPRAIPGSPAIFSKREVLTALNRFAETLASAIAGPRISSSKVLASAGNKAGSGQRVASAPRAPARSQDVAPPAPAEEEVERAKEERSEAEVAEAQRRAEAERLAALDAAKQSREAGPAPDGGGGDGTKPEAGPQGRPEVEGVSEDFAHPESNELGAGDKGTAEQDTDKKKRGRASSYSQQGQQGQPDQKGQQGAPPTPSAPGAGPGSSAPNQLGAKVDPKAGEGKPSENQGSLGKPSEDPGAKQAPHAEVERLRAAIAAGDHWAIGSALNDCQACTDAEVWEAALRLIEENPSELYAGLARELRARLARHEAE